MREGEYKQCANSYEKHGQLRLTKMKTSFKGVREGAGLSEILKVYRLLLFVKLLFMLQASFWYQNDRK